MKRLLFPTLLVLATLVAKGQTTEQSVLPERKLAPVVLSGNAHINVESLLKHIDTKTDVSKLSLSECRVLRNAFAARQGYAFTAGDLRSIFQTTTWYDSLMWARWEQEMEVLDRYREQHPAATEKELAAHLKKQLPLKYNKEQLDFIRKLRTREAELMRRNFETTDGNRVNMANLVNPWQLDNPDQRLMAAIGRQGFAIVPGKYEQLFHIYERNDYHDFPSFVTTDLYLQLYHMYTDCMLREIEENKIYGFIDKFCQQAQAEMLRMGASGDKTVAKGAQHAAAYFAIARSLLTGAPLAGVPTAYTNLAAEEIERCMRAESDYSTFLDYQRVPFAYNLFRPRGHYTRNDVLSRYFRAMMWLQSVPFGTDNDQQLQCAMVIAEAIGRDSDLRNAYEQVTEPLTFLMGTPDNITILQVYEEMQKTGMPLGKLLKNKKEMAKLRKNIESIGENQTRIRPRYEYTSRHKINLMPQRYMPDAEVLQEMVDYDNAPSKRDVPSGLDVFAAMGNTAAERILLSELHEDTRWEGYRDALQRMKQQMEQTNWQQSMATRWMDALATLAQDSGQEGTETDAASRKATYFMQSPQWQKKELNTALASWAELKHDAILYAKQPMGAECGDGGPEPPIINAYVEPAIGFWTKAIELQENTQKTLERYGLSTEKTDFIGERMREEAQFLLEVSRKELEGKTLSDQEYRQLEVIGATYENLTLDMIRDKDQWLQGWSDVQGADKGVAVVADVYTANAENNPMERRSVLYEGVGPASEIYVVVEVGGYLNLMRGAVLSYREFKRALDAPRLTDEEWQKSLLTLPNEGVPTWMDEIVVPLDNEPADNEQIFYSSGC